MVGVYIEQPNQGSSRIMLFVHRIPERVLLYVVAVSQSVYY